MKKAKRANNVLQLKQVGTGMIEVYFNQDNSVREVIPAANDLKGEALAEQMEKFTMGLMRWQFKEITARLKSKSPLELFTISRDSKSIPEKIIAGELLSRRADIAAETLFMKIIENVEGVAKEKQKKRKEKKQ